MKNRLPSLYVTDKDGTLLTILDNKAEKSNHYFDEVFTTDVETGYQTLELKFFKKNSETQAIDVFNFINFVHPNGERYSLKINNIKEDDKTKTIIAETVGIELLNGQVAPIETTEGTRELEYWVNETLGDWSHWRIGVNESTGTSFVAIDQAHSKLARIQELAKIFDVEITFTIDEDFQNRYINFYKKVEKDSVAVLDSEVDLISAEKEVDTSDIVTRLVLEPKTITEEVTITKDLVVEMPPDRATPDKPAGTPVKEVPPAKEETRTVVKTDDRAEKAVQAALGRIGKGDRYRLGARAPGSFDCSGLVLWAYRTVGIDLAPAGLYQTTAWYNNPAAYNMKRVNASKVQRGDLIFFHTSWTSRQPNHVGLVTNPATKEFVHIYRVGVPVVTNKWTQSGWNQGIGFLRPTAIKETTTVTVTDSSGNQSQSNDPNAIRGSSNREKIFNKLKSYGWSDDAVFATMGNIGQESSFNPKARQSPGPGRGLIQWTEGGPYDRWNPLVNWCRSRGLDHWSINGQLRFLVEVELRDSYWSGELKRFCKSYGVPVSGSGYDSFSKGTGVERLVYIFDKAIEKSGTPMYANRIKYANEAKRDFGGGSRAAARSVMSTQSGISPQTITPTRNYQGEYVITETTTEKIDKTIEIKDIEYDDGRFYTFLGQNSVSSHYNDKYNHSSNSSVYIEEFYSTDTEQPQLIVDEMIEALKGRDEPIVTYTISIDDLKAPVDYGDYVTVVFRDWNPALYLEARISGRQESFTDPSKNTYTISNYRLLEGNLKSQYQKMMGMAANLEEKIGNLGELTLSVESMYGTNFKPHNAYTQLRAELSENGRDITDRYSGDEYLWQRYSGHDVDSSWEKRGYVIDIDAEDYLQDITTFKVTDRIGRVATITLNMNADGKSAYQIAVEHGFTGSEEDWLAKLEGADGKDGVQGPKGEDGRNQYLHIAYANSGDGSVGFSIDDPIGKDYIGTYVSNSRDDSLDWTDYEWVLYKGRDGEDAHITDQQVLSDGQVRITWNTGQTTIIPKGQDGSNGLAGPKGEDGRTQYLHIAYANSADGVDGFSTSNSTDKTYLGQYTDYTKADSEEPSDYKWTKIKGDLGPVGPKGEEGEEGKPGDPGPKGEDGQDGENASAFNLLVDGNVFTSTSEYMVAEYELMEPFKSSEWYTLSIKGTKPVSQKFGVWQNSASAPKGDMIPIGGDIYQLSFLSSVISGNNETRVRVYQPVEATAGPAEIEWATLVKGKVGTESWMPSVRDLEDSLNDKVYIDDFNRVQGELSELGSIAVTQQQFGELGQALIEYKEMLDNEQIGLDKAKEDIMALLDRTAGVENELGELTERWNFIDTSIIMGEEGLLIGDTSSETGIRIGTDRIDFLDKGEEVAWITNESLYLKDGILTDSLTVGEHMQTTVGSGMTTWTWTGRQTPQA